MRAVWTIAGRELRASFGRPLAYAVLALFLLLYALLTLGFDDFLTAGTASLRRPLSWLWTCLLLVAPAASMRSFTEEWRSGTWSVLGALPVTATEVVVGKWLGTAGLLGAALALTLPWPIALVALAEPDLGPLLGGYLGLGLGAAALAAVGVAASAWTESVVMAFLLAFLAGSLPSLASLALPVLPSALVPVVEAVSLQSQVAALSRGVVDTRSVLPLVLTVVVALRLAVHAVERRRLR